MKGTQQGYLRSFGSWIICTATLIAISFKVVSTQSLVNTVFIETQFLLIITHIQWGSEIRTCPDLEWSKRGWFAEGLDFNEIWNPQAQPFEKPPKWLPTCIYHLKSRLLSPDFEWSGFQMVETTAIAKARPFENQTICNPAFKKSGFRIFEWLYVRSPLH